MTQSKGVHKEKQSKDKYEFACVFTWQRGKQNNSEFQSGAQKTIHHIRQQESYSAHTHIKEATEPVHVYTTV